MSRNALLKKGLIQAIERKASTRKPSIKFDGEFDARIMQLACSECLEGAGRWTIRLLAEKAVELKITDTVSTMTIQRSLKKTGYALS